MIVSEGLGTYLAVVLFAGLRCGIVYLSLDLEIVLLELFWRVSLPYLCRFLAMLDLLSQWNLIRGLAWVLLELLGLHLSTLQLILACHLTPLESSIFNWITFLLAGVSSLLILDFRWTFFELELKQ